MCSLTACVEEKIAKWLFYQIVIVFDGWAGAGTHRIPCVTNCCSEKDCGDDKVLLSMSPMENESSINTSEHQEFISFVL